MFNIAHRVAILTLHAAAQGWDDSMLKSVVLAEAERVRYVTTSQGHLRTGGSRKKRKAKLYARTHGRNLTQARR